MRNEFVREIDAEGKERLAIITGKRTLRARLMTKIKMWDVMEQLEEKYETFYKTEMIYGGTVAFAPREECHFFGEYKTKNNYNRPAFKDIERCYDSGNYTLPEEETNQ